MEYSVKLISVTPDAEKVITHCARVSNPKNQQNFNTAPKLLKYCIDNQHWSIFQMANMVVEIQTSRGISPQILRHASFSFQEFSQRYAEVDVDAFVKYEARRQDLKNRQNSIDDLSTDDKEWFWKAQQENWDRAYGLYKEALSKGIAKECARFLLPLNTATSLYMNGNVRSWITYLQLRRANGTQKEHADIANSIIKNCFVPNFPVISEALGWKNE